MGSVVVIVHFLFFSVLHVLFLFMFPGNLLLTLLFFPDSEFNLPVLVAGPDLAACVY